MRKHINRYLALSLVGVTGLLSACTEHESVAGNANTFTLATGVSITNTTACSESPIQGLTVGKSGSDYILTAAGAFSCGSEVQTPYLSIKRDKRATLVLDSKSKSSCDCFRVVTVKVSNRLAAGDTLYVLNNGEVLGHVVMP